MDAADIAAMHDFNNEVLLRARHKKRQVVERGICLYCYEEIASDLIYCDADCKADHELQEKILKRTHR